MEFQESTLREVSVRIQGALWREEQALRLSLSGAWYSAAFSRQKRLPALKNILKDRPKRIERQTPEEQRQFFLEFARRAGLRVERHEKPVLVM